MAWNDEVLTSSVTSTPEDVVDRLLQDAEARISEDGEMIAEDERIPVERPMPRRSEADEKGDVRRLDRKMDQTLYLVVKRQGEGKDDGVWGFPCGDVPTDEALHEVCLPSFFFFFLFSLSLSFSFPLLLFPPQIKSCFLFFFILFIFLLNESFHVCVCVCVCVCLRRVRFC
jgi:hypothetical protein